MTTSEKRLKMRTSPRTPPYRPHARRLPQRGQPVMVDTSADDDAACRSTAAAGSKEYVNCRKDRDVQRGNANARTDRVQRNLAEQMLNNPVRP